MLFKTAHQYGLKSSRQIKEIQNRDLVGIKSCEKIIDNTKESCLCIVTSTVGRLKFVCEMDGSPMICELNQDNFFWDL